MPYRRRRKEIAMNIHKSCVDHLRAFCTSSGIGPLSAGHAHEFVAAFCGHSTAAGLRAEKKCALVNLPEADVIIPDYAMIALRISQIPSLAAVAPHVERIVRSLCEHLVSEGHFTGKVWDESDLIDLVESHIIPEYGSQILDGLAGEMATTNAYFEGIDVNDVEIRKSEDGVQLIINGTLDGENDPDKPFTGTSIKFEAVVNLDCVAGRFGFSAPEIELGGEVDMSGYYD
ncbi:conserved hypothetical protein [Aurantimonas manganoxydans SI85-9A1]|uniref:Uncharacterized protein n=2 Tax=Aurantimonas manganoxydans TaxID=651183 RepID=Q1YJT0_AURMS|nr:conserved hypothetical protein [Aurantimonas manganoxydans SI85-9A1]